MDLLERVSRQYPAGPVGPVQTGGAQEIRHGQAGEAGGFGVLLRQELAKTAAPSAGVTFSKHAISRAAERGIEVDDCLMSRLSAGVERAQAKGATNILAMGTGSAFIVNVPTAKVITAITQAEMRESVFTNIDGAVFL